MELPVLKLTGTIVAPFYATGITFTSSEAAATGESF
jgi:hypothetical protein